MKLLALFRERSDRRAGAIQGGHGSEEAHLMVMPRGLISEIDIGFGVRLPLVAVAWVDLL